MHEKFSLYKLVLKIFFRFLRSKIKSRAKVQRQNSRTAFRKEQLGINEEICFRRKKDKCSERQFPHLSLITCREMEQFVLVPLSVYNGSNNPTIVKKQGRTTQIQT